MSLGFPSMRRALPLVVAAVLAGCQLAPATLPAMPPSAGVKVARGNVTVDLSAVRAAWSRRTVLSTTPDFATISQVRLTVLGPDMDTSVSVEADWDGTPLSGDSTTPVTALTLAVPAGKNRVFVLEGLNADGKTLRVIRGLGTVTADQPLTVHLDYLSDAAGRVLEAIYASDATTKAALVDTDVTAKLRDIVDLHIGFDAATNEYDLINPLRFDATQLAGLLGSEGLDLLDGTTPRAELATGLSSAQTITVEDPDGNPVPAEVYLFSPTTGTAMSSDGNGQVVFDSVAPGTWTVAAVAGDVIAWGTLTVGGTDGGTTLELTPPEPGVTTLVDDAGGLSFMSYDNGMTHDAAGNLYVIDRDHFQIKKITPTGTVSVYAGATTGADYDTLMSGAADSATSRLDARFFYPRGIACAPNGDLYVSDASTLRKVTATGVTTLNPKTSTATFEDFGNLKNVAVRADGTVYVLGRSGANYAVFTLDANDQIASQVALTWDTTGDFGPDFNPIDLAVTSTGTVFVSQRYINGIQGGVVKVEGTNAVPFTAIDALYSADGLHLKDDTHLLVTDTSRKVVYEVDLVTQATTLVAGVPTLPDSGSLDGTLEAALFRYPAGITATSFATYVTDGHHIRKIVR